jgi:hypothetical protein
MELKPWRGHSDLGGDQVGTLEVEVESPTGGPLPIKGATPAILTSSPTLAGAVPPSESFRPRSWHVLRLCLSDDVPVSDPGSPPVPLLGCLSLRFHRDVRPVLHQISRFRSHENLSSAMERGRASAGPENTAAVALYETRGCGPADGEGFTTTQNRSRCGERWCRSQHI